MVCKEKTSLAEIEEMEGNLFLPAFKNLKFVDCNKPIYKKLMYWSFALSKKKCDKWDDFDMNVAPYKKDEPSIMNLQNVRLRILQGNIICRK